MKIKNTVYDTAIHACCLLLLVGVTVFLTASWGSLPARVPMHYDFAGEVDRWGSKYEILFLPVTAWAIYILIAVLEQFPGTWNTGIEITEYNRERAYRLLKNLIATVKLILVAAFVFLTMEAALAFRLPAWLLPAFLIILFGDLFYWLRKLMRAR